MKKILLLIVLALTTQTIKAQAVVLDTNGVTIKWTGTTTPSPRWIQASPRGVLEWFIIVDNLTKGSVINYGKNVPSFIISFTPPGGSSPIPFNNIVTTLVTDMSSMFFNATAFNQPIESWDVSKVTNMSSMFFNATAFNQPIGSWDVSKVTSMSDMFNSAYAFNQPIGSWNVSQATNMIRMFDSTTFFNQPIGSWDVGNVTNMYGMFWGAKAFNQPIEAWDVSKVTVMSDMFRGAKAFNQHIEAWDVSQVIAMEGMFQGASAFDQPIGSWDVSNVSVMYNMFLDIGLSTSNYDATLIGWATITPPESPLKSNVNFYGGYSTYCNGASARNLLMNNYGWTIQDSGLDIGCPTLGTKASDTISVSLYPNPASSVLNVKVNTNIVNKPFTITDALGKIVLKGKLNEGDTTLNVEHLSKGIYYLKVSDNKASKFIKE